MADDLQSMLFRNNGLNGDLQNPEPDGDSWITSFGKSLAQSVAEPFGFDKSPGVQNWEAQNPVVSTISGMAGYAVPYLGEDMALAKMEGAGMTFPSKLLNSIGDVDKAPVKTAALREMAKIAPVEAGKIASNYAVRDDAGAEPLYNAALDLGTAGLFSGGIKAIGEYGKPSVKLSELVPGADDTLPPQLQMRAANEFLQNPETPPDDANSVRNRMAEFQKAVRMEEPPGGSSYVSGLEGGSAKDLNRLFRSGTTEDLDKYKFVRGSSGFEDGVGEDGSPLSAVKQINQVWDSTGFPSLRDSAPYIQYPRVTEALTEKGSDIIESTLTRNLQNVGDGTYIGREKNEGMFIIAKQVDEGENPRWVMFKTDTPGKFLPAQEAWADQQASRATWLAKATSGETAEATGSKLIDFAQGLSQKFPLVNYLGLGEGTSKIADFADMLAEKSGLKDVAGGAAQTFTDFYNRYFTPTAYQFGRSPRANYVMGMAKAIYDEGGKAAQELMHGKPELSGTNLFSASLTKPDTAEGGSIKQYLDKLDPNDLSHVWKAWNEQWSTKMAQDAFAQGEFSKPALDFLTHMSSVDKDMIEQIRNTQAAFGEKLFQPMENHYMISRTWAGDWRVPIYNSDGDLIYMSSGKTKNGAEVAAKNIVQGAAKDWAAGDAMLADRGAEAPVSLPGYLDKMKMSPDYLEAAQLNQSQLRVNKPNFMQERTGIGGFTGQLAPWTKQELQDNIMAHLEQQQRYMARLVTGEQFGSDLYRLMAEDPNMYNSLKDRLNDLEGKQGPLGQIQNQIVDKVLAPVLGKNSASKIVTTTNQFMMHFNLGALNVGQAVLHGLQFLQTVIPETAFVLNAVPERLARYYNIFPVAGSDGLLRGAVHALDPIRIMKQSLGEMGKPDEMLLKNFGRAMSDGVISPKLLEDYIGESSTRVKNLKGALKDGQFSGWLRGLSETFLTGAEKLSRGNAFTVGHIIGRDFLSMEDEQLYQFAKKFTQRTMFGYSTADRARVFTTPVGSALGLFKNWMMHFIGSMAEYTGQGVMHDNWSPLLWQLAGTTALGGVAATGPAYFLADQFSKMASNKPLMDNVYNLMGGTSRENLLTGSINPSMSDALFLGLPTLFGVSLATKANTPFGDPAKDASYLFQFVYMDRMQALAKAAGGAIDSWTSTGENPMVNAKVRDEFARALMPKTLYRVAAAWQDKTIRSLNSYNPLYTDASLGERVAYMSGLDPVYVEREQRVSDELWNEKSKMDASIKAYGEAYMQARARNDNRGMQAVMTRSMAQGIDFSRVLKSAASIDAKQNKDAIDRQFSPQAIWAKRNDMGGGS